ncbi:hypothetical protein B296_00013391 [Ensete ventricosum]|uniref:Uncharacterized protein n=1 Tax=Ensete ventricosum TaxID=4639 RepID=A0A427ATB9_ENSVE|nr:hypothetical protein B296_00013391 [Ensete ventricosum]
MAVWTAGDGQRVWRRGLGPRHVGVRNGRIHWRNTADATAAADLAPRPGAPPAIVDGVGEQWRRTSPLPP